MSELEQLRSSLRGVDEALRWYFSCHGSVSRDDMSSMIRAAQSHVETARDIIYASTKNDGPSTTLDNNF